LSVFVIVNPQTCTYKVKFGSEEQTVGPLSRTKFYLYWCWVVSLWLLPATLKFC